MARKFGIPSFSPAGISRRRRFPVKTLALAALFLAIATVGAVVVAGYLRHGRIVRAEEPIGKPIGVPETAAAVTSATPNKNAIASNNAPSPADMAQSDSVRSASVQDAEADKVKPLPTAPESVESSTREVAAASGPPATPDSSVKPQIQDSAPVAANTAAPLPATSDSTAIASIARVGPPPAAPSPDAETRAAAKESAAKKTVMHEVRRAEPAEDELAAKGAEPAPPGNGPDSAPSETMAPETEPRVAETSPAKKTEHPSKPKRPAERKISRERISESERARPRAPGSRRARLVGVTPEGWWMLELPSNRIIIVPPPPPPPSR